MRGYIHDRSVVGIFWVLEEGERELKKELKDFETYELVEELRNREGVELHRADPYEEKEYSVNGPALVLIIVD